MTKRSTRSVPPPIKVSLPESFVPCTNCGLHYIVRGQSPTKKVCERYAERDALPGVT